MSKDFSFSIDRGGTFTDVFAQVSRPDGGHDTVVIKLLSEDPSNYSDAPREGIRRVLEQCTGIPHLRDRPLDPSRIRSIRMGTTVATNALLERKGERCALVVTSGFRDLLAIGNQSRPRIFDLEIKTPDLLYEEVVEVDEQVVLPLGDTPGRRAGPEPWRYPLCEGDRAVGVTGEAVVVRRKPDLDKVREALAGVLRRGIRSLAIVFKHAFLFPDHERAVGAVAREMGFTQVSLSSEVMPMVKMVPRGFTAAADAYLTPHIMKYIRDFQSGFADGLDHVQLSFMQSDGGLAGVGDFSGHRAILSGPAGGYVGYALTTRWDGMDEGEGLQVIGFDMGGTSTDVSRYAGSLEHVFESTTAGVTIQAPQLDISTVAAGGGSRLVFRSGVFLVGPEFVGAHPGPLCYRKGGSLAVTDANLVLGRIVPDFFPKIFGPSEREPLDLEGSTKAFESLREEVNAHCRAHGLPDKTVDEVAFGFLKVANEAMCRPIRELTQMRGYDAERHVLACFGGAGGQHACAIARMLGMKTVFIHRHSGVLSAVGIHLADVVKEAQEPCATVLSPATLPALESRMDALASTVLAALEAQGFPKESASAERFLYLRYEGTDVALMVARPPDGDFARAFAEAYLREFGFVMEGRSVVVDDIRVRGTGHAGSLPPPASAPAAPCRRPSPRTHSSAYFEETGRAPVPVYIMEDLAPGDEIPGPALVIDRVTTVVVVPKAVAKVTFDGSLLIRILPDHFAPPPDPRPGPVAPQAPPARPSLSLRCDPITLAVFSHRFMSIAEQMGRTLQRTSVSVNIKERLDFSCALFGPDGDLVANAPHMPVHLGSMGAAVKHQLWMYTDGPLKDEGLAQGDVLVTNHPTTAGGSHLPDITVITPVFASDATGTPQVVFFVASRGHHADIGGIAPGSMPPHSTRLVEEGAAIESFKLVKGGAFQEEGIRQLLMAPGKLADEMPGMAGCRTLEDSVSDLKAQVAANNKGIKLVAALIGEYGLPMTQAYMRHIQSNAEEAVREMLREFSLECGLPEVGEVVAEDCMDDGTPIRLRVTVDRRDGTALFDFEGTGPEVHGNTNAPVAVTYSAVLYSLRCLIVRDIPLNAGCLVPVRIRIPPGCLLNPSADAAVVGGNVLTSQRVTDVVLKAFKACAASQGCMNNFTFGDAHMGYYETIAGGAGAGPSWHGKAAVQTHMTNTRITDPEILERRYPVVLRRFEVRRGSGGEGAWRGGDGAVREVEFLRPLTVGVLSERRSHRPFGLMGGGPGAAGRNLLLRADGRVVSLGPKATVAVGQGDAVRIETPGGGGYGPADGAREVAEAPGAVPGGFFQALRAQVAAEAATDVVNQITTGSFGALRLNQTTS